MLLICNDEHELNTILHTVRFNYTSLIKVTATHTKLHINFIISFSIQTFLPHHNNIQFISVLLYQLLFGKHNIFPIYSSHSRFNATQTGGNTRCYHQEQMVKVQLR